MRTPDSAENKIRRSDDRRCKCGKQVMRGRYGFETSKCTQCTEESQERISVLRRRWLKPTNGAALREDQWRPVSPGETR